MEIPGWTQFVQFLEASLLTIYHLVGNPGLAIIIFTLLVKLVTLPLTLKSFRSTREMQRIQPLIKEINKRYKDDKAKQQAETMRVYQQHGVNPMGGCLPMLVQLPIFFGLYQALIALVQSHVTGPVLWVQDTHFVGSFLWVPDLSKADPFYVWPVLSAVFQFVTQRMSLAYGYNKTADPQQAMMNRIMQFTPIYLLVIYLNFASGAVLYWTFSGIFTALQTYFVNGFGSLAEVPGLTWLPKRIAPPTPQILEEIAEVDAQADAEKNPRRRPGTYGPGTSLPAASRTTSLATPAGSASTVRPPARGFMAKMMEQAMAAQEAQEAARRAAAAATAGGDGRDTETRALAAEDAPARDDQSTRYSPRTYGNGAAKQTDAPTGSLYGNGAAEPGETSPGSGLPRKRRSRR